MPPLGSCRRLQTKKKSMMERISLRITKIGSFCCVNGADDVFDLYHKDLPHGVMRFVLQRTNQDGPNSLESDWALT